MRRFAFVAWLPLGVGCVSGGGDTSAVDAGRPPDATAVETSVDAARDVSDAMLIFEVDNPTTCGTCPASAPACIDGACVCPTGGTICGGECVDITADPRNCTVCGMACGDNQYCRPKATPPCKCRAPAVACAGNCIDRQIDPTSCGECDLVCPNACARGACVGVCPADLTACPMSGKTACVDLKREIQHCGACGVVCGRDQICAAGKCTAYRPAVGCTACPCNVCLTALPGSGCCPGLLDHTSPICVTGGACP